MFEENLFYLFKIASLFQIIPQQVSSLEIYYKLHNEKI
jgi:hypothetical protein